MGRWTPGSYGVSSTRQLRKQLGTAGWSQLAWSPDGKWLALVRNGNEAGLPTCAGRLRGGAGRLKGAGAGCPCTPRLKVARGWREKNELRTKAINTATFVRAMWSSLPGYAAGVPRVWREEPRRPQHSTAPVVAVRFWAGRDCGVHYTDGLWRAVARRSWPTALAVAWSTAPGSAVVALVSHHDPWPQAQAPLAVIQRAQTPVTVVCGFGNEFPKHAIFGDPQTGLGADQVSQALPKAGEVCSRRLGEGDIRALPRLDLLQCR